MRQLLPMVALALLLASPARAQRCRVTDSTFMALTSDGRFGLVATRGPFTTDLAIRDFERGVPVLETELDNDGAEAALESDELMALGEQRLEGVERRLYGTLAEVKHQLAPTCPAEAFEQGLSGTTAADIDVSKDRFSYGLARPPYVVLVFEHHDEDESCDEDRGDRVLGFRCGDAPKGSADASEHLTSAKPSELRSKVAAVGARTGNALEVLGLLGELEPPRRAALPRDVRLGLVVEELSALRRLGFLGRSACRQRALATYSREAPKPGQSVPPAEVALFREIERQRRGCLAPSVAP